MSEQTDNLGAPPASQDRVTDAPHRAAEEASRPSGSVPTGALRVSDLPPPTGLRRAWEHNGMTNGSTGDLLRLYHADPAWGDPVDSEAWFDSAGRLKVCRAVYAHGRVVVLRKLAGSSRTEFSRHPRAALSRAETPGSGDR
jgi:hypothetical protein